jgi:hypothetical protein
MVRRNSMFVCRRRYGLKVVRAEVFEEVCPASSVSKDHAWHTLSYPVVILVLLMIRHELCGSTTPAPRRQLSSNGRSSIALFLMLLVNFPLFRWTYRQRFDAYDLTL